MKASFKVMVQRQTVNKNMGFTEKSVATCSGIKIQQTSIKSVQL